MKFDEFNLSEEREPVIANFKGKSKVVSYTYSEESVKRFIKKIMKDIIIGSPHARQQSIKLMKLAGDDLI